MAGDLPAWKQEYDRSNDPKREPGPIQLSRYLINAGYSGIKTFMGLPLCLTPEDLKAGEVDVAIIGAPIDMGVGHRGTAFGPAALRNAERYLPNGPVMTYNHTHVMVSPFETLTCVDYGDAGVDPLDMAASHEEVIKRVAEIAAAGAIPIILGGDHSLMRADVMGLTQVYGKGNVGVIHFDAHYDAADTLFGHHLTHGTPVRRLIEDGHVLGKNFVQVGLRGFSPREPDMAWMRAQGIRSHYMAEVERDGFHKVVDRAIAEALDGAEHLFVSFDIDVLDPAFAPGTGTPEPGGLTTREVFPIMRRVCAECHVVGVELVEVAPGIDPGYTTALNGVRVIQEAITGLAMYKLGQEDPKYREPHYLDPRTSGQDPVPGQRND